jgi:hypothetical protein
MIVLTACAVRSVLGAPVFVQSPKDLVVWRTVREDSAAVVEDQRIGLALCWP